MNIKKWMEGVRGGLMMVAKEIDEIGRLERSTKQSEDEWNPGKSRTGAQKSGEVAEDGWRDRGMSNNAEANE
jgi:hypothetical protein